ncbi:M23 family metallopeptidase [Microbacterium trichothecenolyticum]|uniref:Murein DD-endopeptidase MepM/ murein hydrolase activator NlpD n=1 Tax=Microbacterium trichothecenolyticum TaxID=69370 RepID=A0ABU0TX51_MICTR|nr:M23 family metallopeptidase [Microbacterium trichothecenolyticum]MDQ1123512.1 murein DD-endopeptidase MepM/ murein hydrolase activator NlpD [Microbacterium trichothecenolyticum]
MTLERPDESEDCGCAPTAEERRRLWPSFDRRSALKLGAFGAVAVGAFGAVAPSLGSPAFAADYPSWADVEAARANEAAKAGEISRIQGLIQGLQSEVARTQAEVVARSDEYYAAQQAYFDADYRAQQIQTQADAKAAEAVDAANKAGKVAAQLYRSGGDDTSLDLFFSGSAATADDLLAKLGTMDKLIERNRSVYAAAVTARDSAQQLSNQASDARTERDRLQKIAEEKMQAAQQAADAAQAALAEQQANQATLEAQLAALQDTTAKTVADYQAGVEAERKAREERERKAREEAEARDRAERERREQEERDRANNNSNNGGGGGGDSGGGGGGGNGGGGGPGGWSRPSWAGTTSGYGPRSSQCNGSYCASSWHLGLDFGAGCWSPIYAAFEGRVSYAGYNGGYGNYIRIEHPDGSATGYAHIVNGGIYVSNGQWVNSGQQIAAAGQTGNSFGCHLHFEVYPPWGGTTDPAPWLRWRGIDV